MQGAVRELRARARELVACQARAAERSGRLHYVTLTRPVSAREVASDALRVFCSAQRDEPRFYWEQPSADRAIAALGEVACTAAPGEGRFERSAQAARALFSTHAEASLDGAGARALLVGGFAFAPRVGDGWRTLGAGSLVLPRVLFARDAQGAWLSVSQAVQPDCVVAEAARALCELSEGALAAIAAVERAPDGTATFRVQPDRSHAEFADGVRDAVAAIASGELEKVVLARAVDLSSDARLDAGALLAELRRAHPACTVFAVARGAQVFLGATPELLVRLDGARIETSAVAGSAARGRSPEADARRARALRESKKEQEEHAVVVREIERVLNPLCSELVRPEAPDVLALEGIQHLETRFSGRIADASLHVLELVERLHPTPAVGGAPRGAARTWIDEHEALDRGWYAGPIGFVDARGSGELYVALRSALLDEPRGKARLFAGAGIVAGSEASAELRETRLKLAALLAPLLEV